MHLAGLLVALLLVVACASTSHLVATRVLPEGSASARLAAAAIIGYALLVAIFFLLSPTRWFRLGPAIATWVGVATLVHVWLGRGGEWRVALRRDLAAARDAWAAAGWARWMLLATFPILLRVARGLVSPPLGWDSLTYHLAKAGMWVQAGGFTALPGPDANRWYDQFPAYADVLWAWAMLPVHGDALLALAGAGVWLVALLATYACAREVGAAPRGALLAALAVGLAPAAASYVATSYVDNVVWATFLVAGLFLLRAVKSGRGGDAGVAGIALGVLAGTKSTGILVTGAALALVAVVIARSSGRARRLLLVVPIAAAVGALPYLRAWVETGNPLYPFPVGIAGHTIFPAAAGVLENWAERTRELPAFSLFLFVARLATPIPLVPEADRMGFGPGILLLFPLAVLGGVRLIRQGRAIAVGVFATLSAGLVVSQFGAAWIWILDIGSVQRYVLGIYASFAILAAWLDGRREQVVLAAVAISGAVLALPRGIGPAEWGALLAGLPVVGLAAAAVAGAVLLRRGRAFAAGAFALAGVLAALALLAPIRARVRHDVYRDAALNRSFDPHFLHPSVVQGWPIWKMLDAAGPRRIAVTAGYDLFPNWYWYPLLGSTLQNRVAYVPITADGSLVDYRDPDEAKHRASFTSWLRRLLDAGIDEVVLLAPAPLEAEWVASAPDVFAEEAVATDGASRVFRVRVDAARRHVAAARSEALR